MKSVYERKEHNTGELKVTVDGELWSEAQKKAKKKLAQNLNVPGFRKGHVPANMIDKYISNEQVMYEAIDKLAQEALEFGLNENDVRLVDRPTLDVDSLTSEEATLKFLLTVYPEVKLNNYKDVEYKVGKVSVTKKEVEEEIHRLQLKHAQEVLKEEGSVVNGDIAVIDFEGFVDGVAFEGGKGSEYPLEIGSGSFIPGFEEQIIGMSTGEEKDINVTFPNEYAPELAGKDATFKVKVEGIKEKVLPEVDEEFIAELNMGEDVKTAEDLTKHIKEQLKASKTSEAENKANDDLLTGLCEASEVEIPEVMIEQEVEETYQNYAARLSQQGIGMDMYFQITGLTAETFKETLKDEAEKKVRIRLVLEAIGKDMGIVASEEEVEEEYKAMSEQYQMDVEQIKKLVPANYLSDDVTMRKTLEELKKGNKKEEKAE